MRALIDKKQKAIELRGQGYTYSEIAVLLHVSMASLSLWIKDVPVPASYYLKLKRKEYNAHHKAKIINRERRQTRSYALHKQGMSEISSVSLQELKYIGLMLYWAEGSKQKPHNVSERVVFGNSDLSMIKIYLLWVKYICHIDPKESCSFELCIHESADVLSARMVWSQELGMPASKIRIRYKKHNPKPFRRVKHIVYKGLMRVSVKKSTDLNRRINGLTQGIINQILKTYKT